MVQLPDSFPEGTRFFDVGSMGNPVTMLWPNCTGWTGTGRRGEPPPFWFNRSTVEDDGEEISEEQFRKLVGDTDGDNTNKQALSKSSVDSLIKAKISPIRFRTEQEYAKLNFSSVGTLHRASTLPDTEQPVEKKDLPPQE